ncbi:MAG: hypothetical protein RR073_04425 [Clostridia bacterium]
MKITAKATIANDEIAAKELFKVSSMESSQVFEKYLNTLYGYDQRAVDTMRILYGKTPPFIRGNTVSRYFARLKEKVPMLNKIFVNVQRNPEGKLSLPLERLVIGDIIYLEKDDIVPIDVRVLKADNLYVNQELLTDDKTPILKTSERCDTTNKKPAMLSNLVFAGSKVTKGSATAIVVAIG